MKKLLALILILAVASLAACATTPETDVVRVSALKGPTGIGLLGLMEKTDSGEYTNYVSTIYGTADEIVPLLVNGDTDIALIPANLASVLYNNTNGGVLVAAINTLGVLYVLESGNTIQSVEDLENMSILCPGKGTTPEYALQYILSGNNISANVEFKSESSEIAALLAAGDYRAAVLPQPYAATVLMKNPDIRIALSLTDEWEKLGASLLTGVVAVRAEFAKENPNALAKFLEDYKASVNAALSDYETTSALCEKYGIVKAEVALKALPYCGITYMDGEDMSDALLGYLGTLYDFNPKSVGGTRIDKDIFVK